VQFALIVPTVKDRVVQMAVKLVIEPLFEADFVPCSFGFRPEKTPCFWQDPVAHFGILIWPTLSH
jgi:RNA-directed DNA polymerase